MAGTLLAPTDKAERLTADFATSERQYERH
jgi:hypothetical protein